MHCRLLSSARSLVEDTVAEGNQAEALSCKLHDLVECSKRHHCPADAAYGPNSVAVEAAVAAAVSCLLAESMHDKQ